MRFSVGIVGHGSPKFPHAACFDDFAKAIADALRALGHEVVPPTDANPGRLVMFGANNVRDPHGRIPKDAIVFNTEQVSAKQQWNLMQNLPQYRGMAVWDYAESNVQWLQAQGVERAVLCPAGYIPTMERIAPLSNGVEDVDVLFYGSMNERRQEILDALKASGLTVRWLYGVYGAERDAWIARSKVVLNLHFYEDPVFEIVRVSHLLANRKCVVSEGGGIDPGLEDFAARACALVPRGRIVEECLRLVKDAEARQAVADRGYDAFRAIDLVGNVDRALSVTPPAALVRVAPPAPVR